MRGIKTSVYRYYDDSGFLIYVGITRRGPQRQAEHNRDKEWWPFVASQQVTHYETRDDARAAEKVWIERHHPPFNTEGNPDWAERRETYLLARSHGQTPAEHAAFRAGWFAAKDVMGADFIDSLLLRSVIDGYVPANWETLVQVDDLHPRRT